MALRLPKLGPGMLVTAAFVGPGTIATATTAGVSFGYALLWALLFSVLATTVLQEMSVRQALITGNGLSRTMRETLRGNWFGRLALLLVVLAVGLGNAAYESGNIAGATLALGEVSKIAPSTWALLIGLIAAGLLFLPAYRQIERALVTLVLLMSLVFVASALALSPLWPELIRGLTLPSLPDGSATMIIALVGTTVVPYNLFLQANAARDRWSDTQDRQEALRAARWDTVLSVALGGIITVSLVSAAAVSFYFGDATFSQTAFSEQLVPVLGESGRWIFALGLLAAGLTSAVTAPLAAGYAVCGALGLDERHRGVAFRCISLGIVAIGTLFAVFGGRPLSLIIFAQAANGLLLPIIAGVLLWLMNQRGTLGAAANGWLSNLLGAAVLLVTLGLGLNKLISLF
ncbi:MAG: Nramp family divalent metal transporter [Congregibacter sp.]